MTTSPTKVPGAMRETSIGMASPRRRPNGEALTTDRSPEDRWHPSRPAVRSVAHRGRPSSKPCAAAVWNVEQCQPGHAGCGQWAADRRAHAAADRQC